MKKVIMLCSLVLLMIMNSCKKDKSIKEEQNIEAQMSKLKFVKTGTESLFFNNGKLDFDKKVNDLKNDYLTKSKAQIDVLNKPGRCAYVKTFTSSYLGSNYYVCSNPNVTLYYRVAVLKSSGFGEFNLNFGLNLVGSGYSPSAVNLVSENEICGYLEPEINPCAILATYEVNFVVSRIDYDNSQNSTLEASTFCTTYGTVEYFYKSHSLTYPCSFFTNAPASIYVYPDTGGFTVLTLCGFVCHDYNHIPCSQGGIFNYRLISSLPTNPNPWISVPLNVFGTSSLINTINGNYEYSCTLNYSCGTTLPKIGTFTIL